jgi:hypothetical protein
MDEVRLFAWAAPAAFQGNVVDHTWVTAYDNRVDDYSDIQAVSDAQQYYWYCWGSYHSKGGVPGRSDGFLVSGQAAIAYACCLCKPNVDSKYDVAAQGTIFAYGWDGVCHQLANQILWATDPTGSAPALVDSARGYRYSEYLFGAYGKRQSDWINKRNGCLANGSLEMGIQQSTPSGDSFEKHVHKVLTGPKADEKIRTLLEHRRAVMSQIDRLRDNPNFAEGRPSAADLNKLYSSFLRDAAKILGDDDFERVFDQRPAEEMNVVDPDVYNASNAGTASH